MTRWYEWECEHGVGHPRKDYIKKYGPGRRLSLGTHCCDGCCGNEPENLPPLEKPSFRGFTEEIMADWEKEVWEQICKKDSPLI